MIRLRKIRAFTLIEIFNIFLLRISVKFSIFIFHSEDLLHYYKKINKLIIRGFFFNRVNSNVLEIFTKNERYLVRRYGSDIQVFDQIVINGEYNHLINLIHKFGLGDSSLTVVDCGSNIGMFSAWMLNRAKIEKIVSIEADKENYLFQKLFMDRIGVLDKFTFLNNAIWSDSNSILKVSSDFRDGLDWAKRVSPTTDVHLGTVKSITLNQVFEEFLGKEIHILKMDIEGAEKFVFENECSLDKVLINTRIIAIEIHDEVNSASLILNKLNKYGFILENFGETTFGYKSNLE